MTYNNIVKKLGSRLFTFMITGLMLISISANAESSQGKTVTGKVIGALDGEGLPGVNVLLKGSQGGTITDMNGQYSLQVEDENSILVFSYVGYNAEEITVGDRSVIDVEMIEDITALNEVVVTALGIKREERSLGYSVGKVDGEEVARVAQENVLNSLAGKVAGVTISSTGGTGSSVSMVIRGATSLSSDNQPLFVVDGVPVVNTLNNMTQFGDRNIVDYGNAISDINPDDIENISILKGPSAAALYGSRAGNGVVLITTKTGKKGQGVKVTVNSNTVFDQPYRFYGTQKQFAPGYFSFTPDDIPAGSHLLLDPAQAAGAGIEVDRGYFGIQWDSPRDANGVQIPTEIVSYKDNLKNFVETGVTTTNGVSVSNGNDILNYRMGFTNMTSKGIIPNSDLHRNNISTAASLKATDKLTISSNINITKSWADNRPSSNRGTNVMQAAHNVPLSTDIRNLKDYWEPGFEGVQQRVTRMPSTDPKNSDYNNPYFLANEVNNSFNRDRLYGNLKAEYQITPDITVMGRYSIDQFSEKRETKISPSYTRERNNGHYGIANITSYERNLDVLATYSKVWDAFNLTASVGGNSLFNTGSKVVNSAKNGAGLIVPNVYSIGNIKSGGLSYGSSWYQRAIYSAYALVNLGWKDMIYLDLTARNDWSSTLPVENQSYFYPSASLSLMINEMVNMGNTVNQFKIRGGYAKVGNDADPYQLLSVYGNSGQWGDAIRLNKSSRILTPDLEPEEATSYEAGIDLGLFENRLRLEGTYYMVDNRNQIIKNIPIASSTGSDLININAGLIQSQGWEFLLGTTPISTNNWTWDANINFSRNRTKVIELAPGVDRIEFWDDARGGAFTYVGDEVGNIYDAKMVRVEDPTSPYYQYPIIGGEDNSWQDIEISDLQGERNKIGNYNPDFLVGMQNTVSYKGFTLNMTFDWRKGGQFISQTHRYTASDASSQKLLDDLINPNEGLPEGQVRQGRELRDWLVENEEEYILNGFNVVGGPTAEYGGFPENYSGIMVNDGVFVPGVVQTGVDENGDPVYVENLGENNLMPYMPFVVSSAWGFAEYSMFDADFVKLREISLSYQFPQSLISRVKGIEDFSISLYSRNIILWTEANIGIDPERAFQAEAGTGNRGTQFKQGIERFNIDPWVIPIGFKLNLTF